MSKIEKGYFKSKRRNTRGNLDDVLEETAISSRKLKRGLVKINLQQKLEIAYKVLVDDESPKDIALSFRIPTQRVYKILSNIKQNLSSIST